MDAVTKFHVVKLKQKLLDIVVLLQQESAYGKEQIVEGLEKVIRELDGLDLELNRAKRISIEQSLTEDERGKLNELKQNMLVATSEIEVKYYENQIHDFIDKVLKDRILLV
ncbi:MULTISPECIES: hypothetical protein [Bacillaceae]|uniref:hypothetical protein n=1 Tax=Bacillaceae TaxID=186817 RepID=UPI000E2EFDAE|nr:hypothetical protein [Bacillus sp. HNG]RFB09459.1 hypothetical protein DZB84_24270 [Bacillus sp. HNG]